MMFCYLDIQYIDIPEIYIIQYDQKDPQWEHACAVKNASLITTWLSNQCILQQLYFCYYIQGSTLLIKCPYKDTPLC